MDFKYKNDKGEEIVITKDTDLSSYGVAELSKMYTQMIGKETTFRQKAVGQKMIKAMLTQTPDAKPVGDGKPADGKTAAQTRRSPRKGDLPTDKKLDFIIDPNPKRSGSKARAVFDKYKVGLTIPELTESGITMDHIRYDIAHGFIHFEGMDKVEPTNKPKSPQEAAGGDPPKEGEQKPDPAAAAE